jgi:hypothetical protein
MVSNRASTGSRSLTELERLIEQDLARINNLNTSYTCCPGTCTAVRATIEASTTCATDTAGTVLQPGSDRYYSPVQPYIPIGGTYNAAMASFRNACTNGTLAPNLIAAFPAPPTPPAGATLTRSTPTIADPVSHRVEWTYSAAINGSTVITRVVNMIPTAASWCP